MYFLVFISLYKDFKNTTSSNALVHSNSMYPGTGWWGAFACQFREHTVD